MIINTRIPITKSRFRNHVKRRGPITVRSTDDAKSEHVITFGLGNLQTIRRKVMQMTEDRRSGGANVMSHGMFNRRFIVEWMRNVRKFVQ